VTGLVGILRVNLPLLQGTNTEAKGTMSLLSQELWVYLPLLTRARPLEPLPAQSPGPGPGPLVPPDVQEENFSQRGTTEIWRLSDSGKGEVLFLDACFFCFLFNVIVTVKWCKWPT
jgi:hypothetical protein